MEWQATLLYMFTTGISSAPRVFTKILKPIFAHLREQGISIVCYIDDSLIISDSREDCELAVNFVVQVLDSLGFKINSTKSAFAPVQCIEFLGFMLDSSAITVSLTERKTEKIKRLRQTLINHEFCKIRDFAELISNLVAAAPAVEYAPRIYKGLEIS